MKQLSTFIQESIRKPSADEYKALGLGDNFYIGIDAKSSDGATDVKIVGNKIIIRELAPETAWSGNHQAYLRASKAGSYTFDIDTDCPITLNIMQGPAQSISLKTSGQPLAFVTAAHTLNTLEVLDMSGAEVDGFFMDGREDGWRKLREIYGPTCKECVFGFGYCKSLKYVDLSGIGSTPSDMVTVTIKKCPQLKTIIPPQAFTCNVYLEDSPKIDQSSIDAFKEVCERSGKKLTVW